MQRRSYFLLNKYLFVTSNIIYMLRTASLLQ